MHVILTAGHVDHGKSTLVRALTGMEPDRWAEERRRGMTIDLGFAWLTTPSGDRIAFVDVPGHERFVPNMLAGAGPVPAVLFVVAADEGWMPQSAEHLAALHALGIQAGVLAVTPADLADPEPAMTRALAEIEQTSLGRLPAVAVSSVSGQGLQELVAALDRLGHEMPPPDPCAPVRIWVDRSFSMSGSGTVVTGTLPAGTLHGDDELVVTPSMRPVRIRSIQSLGEAVPDATGPARVALNLRGISKEGLGRGMALVQAGRWTMTDLIDVRLVPGGQSSAGEQADGQLSDRLPRMVTVHVGSARAVARVRALAPELVRLSLRDPLPLHVGDRILLRDPGAARAPQRTAPRPQAVPRPPAAVPRPPVPGPPPSAAHANGQPAHAAREVTGWPAITGGIVLDVAPPPLVGRGAAASAVRELSTWPDRPQASDLLRRHGILRASALLAMGVREHPEPVTGEWLVDPAYWHELTSRLGEVIAAHAAREPLSAGLPAEAARAALGLPDRRLVAAMAKPPFRLSAGLLQVMPVTSAQTSSHGDIDQAEAVVLPDALEAAVRVLLADLAQDPFLAPDADRLRRLGVDLRGIAAAARSGRLLRISDQIVLAPGADLVAARILAGLPQPFTAAEARQALTTTRRTAIPLLEYLDRAGITERLPDDRRNVRPVTAPRPESDGLAAPAIAGSHSVSPS